MYSYLYLKIGKTIYLSYYFICFLFNTIGEGVGREVGDGIMYTHVSKCKNYKIKGEKKKKTVFLHRFYFQRFFLIL
jgi:hypothetical protein